MDDYRADGPGCGGKSEFAAGGKASAPDEVSVAGSADRAEGDIIRGLRSGLIFSLALWAMLFPVGALLFD